MLAAGFTFFQLSAQLSHATQSVSCESHRGVSPAISKTGTTKAMVERLPTFQQSNINMTIKKNMHCFGISMYLPYLKTWMFNFHQFSMATYHRREVAYLRIYSVELKRRAALLECTETHASELRGHVSYAWWIGYIIISINVDTNLYVYYVV